MRLRILLGLSIAVATAAARWQQPPGSDVPIGLCEAWLRFHEAELCQGVDATFEFHGGEMSVRSLVQDERSYQKFQELLAPLESRYRINLSAERPPADKKSDDDKYPPPSLWENYELRAYLGDPVARGRERPGFLENRSPDLPPPDDMLKQQLVVYASQTLDWNRKIERYAADLPALARMAYDAKVAPSLRARAAAVCRAHLQNLEKYASKLRSNLAEALPKGEKKDRAAGAEKLPELREPVGGADQIADTARSIARRVYRFIHPEQFTVGLDELRQPGLLDSLKALERMNAQFHRELDRSYRPPGG